MTKQQKLEKMLMCVQAIEKGIKKDYEYQNNAAKRTDGTADWFAAAAYFSDLIGEKVNCNDFVTLFSHTNFANAKVT